MGRRLRPAGLAVALAIGPAVGFADTSLSSLDALQSLTQGSAQARTEAGVTPIRAQLLRETAVGLGARAALNNRFTEIRVMLDQQSKRLDAVFNFNGLMLPDNVLPPVLSQANDVYLDEGKDVVRTVDSAYKIERPPRFVSAVPTWRDYLVRLFPAATSPHSSLLPKNDAERQLWKGWAQEGWEKGIQQAENIFWSDLARLQHDIRGMIMYRELFAKRMVSKPFVAKSSQGVTGDDTRLNVNERTLRITASPKFDLDDKKWRPIIQQGTDKGVASTPDGQVER